jgi:hypothetical protein
MSNPDDINYEVMEPEGTFKNKGYKEWVQDWSNWFYQPYPDRNNNGDVVFLRSISFHKGVYSKEPNVMIGDDSLVISESQRVLVPIITANSVPYNTERPEIMYGFVRSHILNGDNPPLPSTVKINREEIKFKHPEINFSHYEVETPIFQIAIPDDTEGYSLKNYGEHAIDSTGFFPAVTRGYFVLLQFMPNKDQQVYCIESSALGATTDRGEYGASLFYHIIVNKSAQKPNSESISKALLPRNRPNRNIQIVVEKKYANKEIGEGEYLDIMAELGILEKDQRFGEQIRRKGGHQTTDQVNQ